MQSQCVAPCRLHIALAVLWTTVLSVALTSEKAQAVVYLTGSVSASTMNAGLQTHESNGGAASIAFDLGSYIRLGFTHKQQFQRTEGYTGETDDNCKWEEGKVLDDCHTYSSRAHITANSIDLTLILYNGEIVTPFIQGGGVLKHYDIETSEDGVVKTTKGTVPAPQVGAGLGIRLNKQFTLKLTYTTSPGTVQTIQGEQKGTWDRDMSVGITYAL